MKDIQQVALDSWGKVSQGMLHSYILSWKTSNQSRHSEGAVLYCPILFGTKSDYIAGYLLPGYLEVAYKVMSLCINVDNGPLWTVTLVWGENTMHLVWWKACFHASLSSSLKLQIPLYPLRCLSDGEKVLLFIFFT